MVETTIEKLCQFRCSAVRSGTGSSLKIKLLTTIPVCAMTTSSGLPCDPLLLALVALSYHVFDSEP